MTVPRILHLTWKTKILPDKMRTNLELWRKLMPNWEVRLYDDADLAHLVKTHSPQHWDSYCALAVPIERVDMARPVMLAAVGGVYADLDMEPRRALDPLCDNMDVTLATEPPEHWVDGEPLLSNALMISQLNSTSAEFWRGFLDYIVAHYDSKRGPVDNTGPKALARYVRENGPAVQQCKLRIVSACLFNGALDTAMHPELPQLSRGCTWEDAYTVHQWHHTWLASESRVRNGFPYIALLILIVVGYVALLVYKK
jgi:hypothetical protein